MNDTIKLRPHHLLDILRDFGNQKPLEDHPFGASVKSVYLKVLTSVDNRITMVPRVDSICETCSMLENDICQVKLRENLLMRDYNDNLDDNLFRILNIIPFDVISLKEFIIKLDLSFDRVLSQFTSPDNNPLEREKGTQKSIAIFKK